MRILIVTQRFWPENFRINDLATELVRRGHEVACLVAEATHRIEVGTVLCQLYAHTHRIEVGKRMHHSSFVRSRIERTAMWYAIPI
jgi:hypothetical protein